MTRYGIIGGTSFFLALGLVGGVENGAPIHNMLYAFALIAVMGVCIALSERKEKEERDYET
jgi:hypothetical protein